jgi:anhydro-N-acetylmuramic acid kinase
MKELQGIGLMSGSSLDGLDVAHCRFVVNDAADTWPLVADWSLVHFATLPLPAHLRKQLEAAPQMSGRDLMFLHTTFGSWLGDAANAFMQEHRIQPDFIASHGHTIFHFPDRHTTVQLGCGAAIAARTGRPAVTDFRSMDIALGGEGAPLAPTAERLLFHGYDLYLNIGGIANISACREKEWVAFDVAPANQLLNFWAGQLGASFDPEGRFARSGHLLPGLLAELEALPFYKKEFPKSIDNNWIRETVNPIILTAGGRPEDKLHTLVIHLVAQLENTIRQLEEISFPASRMLVTGGGAFNEFLVEKMREKLKAEVVIPEKNIVEYKEAVLMALMGALRMLHLPNCMHSVTGASSDSSGGAIYYTGNLPKSE